MTDEQQTKRSDEVDENELAQDLEIKHADDAEAVKGGAATDGDDALWNWRKM